MFTLSFGKLALLVLVVIAVWKGLALFRRMQAQLEARNREAPNVQQKRKAEPQATVLVPCPHCGTYIPNGTYCRCRDKA